MRCDNCKKNEATLHISQTINGKTQEQHLCANCAQETGINNSFNPYVEEFLKSGSIAQGIFNTAGGIPAFGNTGIKPVVCSSCGQRYEEFRKSGLLGCSNCYKAFEDRLDAIFRRVQGGNRHVGRKACETAGQQELLLYRHQMIDLKNKLQEYVEKEEYEKAAELRDEIRDLQKQITIIEKQNIADNCKTAQLPSKSEASSEIDNSKNYEENDNTNGEDSSKGKGGESE